MEKKEKKSELLLNTENGWNRIDDKELPSLEAYAKEYISFLSKAKTERLAHDFAVEKAKEKGYVSVSEKEKLQPGDKVYISHSGRTVFFILIGKKDITEGMNLLGGHIDCPRIDLKPNPLYEDSELAFFDTHYYGGIRKYQWVALPLAVHGHVVKQDGSVVNFSVGENEDEPVFSITDLLPHLAQKQAEKTIAEAVTGENLNLLIGTVPVKSTEAKLKVKEKILQILNEKYGMKEEDFNSADIQMVPAGKAREMGFDRSMILGYGQDDRICSFAAFKALMDMNEIPEYTAGVLLCDKEEVGSYGATGMQSFFFENAVAEVLHRMEKISLVDLNRTLSKSKMLSADVNSLHDPNFPEVSSPNNNMPQMNRGTIIQKYTGARGKSGASEASPEFVAEVRKIFNTNGVLWQTGELGKVDLGGSGTIAYYMARYGMDVIDCGPGLFSMHAPFEVSSKLDAYMTWKGFKAFLNYKR
jgi:aspartyl aminopeptidase